jgi:hypothetical protein
MPVVGTCVTTKDRIPQLNTFPNDLASAKRALWQHGAHGTFKTVKDMFFTPKVYFKTLSIFPAHFTT